MAECGNVDGGVICERPERSHPRCTGFDPALDDFRNWVNPNYEPPKNTGREDAKATIRRAAAATAPDVRGDGSAPSSGPLTGRWSDEERALVRQALWTVCERHAGGGEFTSEEVWDELAGRVRMTHGLASIIKQAERDKWLGNTGKKGRSQRRRKDHDDGRELVLWYSLLKRPRR